jgi:N-acetyl-gamma-glutamyl-phosphate reductase
MPKIKVGIIGATGYTGYELVKILVNHKEADLVAVNSESAPGKKVKEIYPDFDKELVYTGYSIDEINKIKPDVVFLALPHTAAMEWVPKLKCKIIDLSADYRFKKAGEYEKAYGLMHKDKKTKAVYGLPEIFKEKIKKAKLIANPGCYATGMILSLLPIDKKKMAKHIVFDCKSGWSGAGKNSAYAKDSSITKDNIIAYNIVKHRHKYEVQQFIKTKISFTPHVIDTFQGMMITSHILLKKKEDAEQVKKMYKDFYKGSAFVEVVDKIPDLHAVQKTNKLMIGGFETDENNQMVIVAVLDNLIKGASGQAVQNMNIMFGFPETEGLK